jgi:hypothetical protein
MDRKNSLLGQQEPAGFDGTGHLSSFREQNRG